MDTTKADKEAMWATSGTGEDFQCVHIDEYRDIELLLREAVVLLQDKNLCEKINNYLNITSRADRQSGEFVGLCKHGFRQGRCDRCCS